MADQDFGQLFELLERIERLAQDPDKADEAAALAAALLAVLGSGPSIARIEEYIAAHQPEGPHGPGYEQQQIDEIIGMITTMRIVAEMLGYPFQGKLPPPA